MVGIKTVSQLIAFAVMAGFAITVAVADEKLEGKVVGTNLTLCQPRPTGGGCAGTLTLEPKASGAAQQVVINVIADTIIRKGKDYLFLPATQGSMVVVSYVTDKGQKVAKSIDVVGATQ
jgi:hypothetical protein